MLNLTIGVHIITTVDGKHFNSDMFGHHNILSVRSVCSFACMMKHLASGLSHKSEAAGPENHIF